jgi:hypothetical protein
LNILKNLIENMFSIEEQRIPFFSKKKKTFELICEKTIITINHGLFDWKIKPKTSHFDIWSI